MLKGTGSISLRRHDSMEKDTRTEFEKWKPVKCSGTVTQKSAN